jgi:HYR domain
MKRLWVSLVVVVLSFGVVPVAVAGDSAAAGTLELRAAFQLVSVRDQGCPPGIPTSPTTQCAARTGSGVAPGLGSVTYAYAFPVDVGAAPCDALSARALRYPVRVTVVGKGEIHFDLRESPCVSTDNARTVSQDFTVTGGTGLYAGASGTGTVVRALGPTDTGAAGIETWSGTLTVPGLEFDVTPPTLSGATSRTVRVPGRATRVRVTYTVTATDATDGAITPSCRPASGSRFRIGRTIVTCRATDSSGNTRDARFVVTVRRRR